MTNLVKTAMYNPASEEVLNIYRVMFPTAAENLQITYTTATKAGNNHRNAITEIGLTWGDAVLPAGWEKVSYDMGPVLRSGNSGKIAMYLIYRRVN